MYDKLLIFIGLCLIMLSCGKGGKQINDIPAMVIMSEAGNDSLPATVKLSIDIRKAVPLEDRLAPISMITLNEDVENLPGVPFSTVVREDTIFFIEPIHTPGFYAYSEEGRQIFSYHSPGTGPKDMLKGTCLKVTDTELSAFDYGSYSIVVIDKRGEFVRKIELPIMSQAGILGPDGDVWADFSNTDQGMDNAMVIWRKDSLSSWTDVLTVPEHLKGMMRIEKQTFRSLRDGTIVYLPSFQPRIYSLSHGNAKVRYELDFNGLYPNEQEMEEKYGGYAWAPKTRNFPVKDINYEESDRWVVIMFRNGKDHYLYLYDKVNHGEEICIDKNHIFNSLAYVTDDKLYVNMSDDKMGVFEL